MSDKRGSGANRRKSVRYETLIPVILGAKDHSREYGTPARFEGRIVELSAGGMRVNLSPVTRDEYRDSLKKGFFFSAKGRLPGAHDDSELYGSVVWSEFADSGAAGECSVGVCFQRLAGPPQKALDAALARLADVVAVKR